ncbi:TPA: hypothetical protein KDZ97_003684 [Vibrio parahaemolyticus]|uniref:hypothetical protein n=1 Tax=Vibrio parahaemolyticus TaxID=670 RepID=UPI001B82D985|nr:hypothetical protein [Vibrio parahaemolyticus]MDF5646620.1 hypothetical protein [Vibrio parahaemolyticus]MDF5666121.1 hypothetical protein [Vibrio parahaemolyticus]WKV19374.1 hypothetical protein [Vibrio parahaemolyticus]HBC3539150.1 hypothetical protein [Vibrio parahaemolyticus]HBC3815591.1 hypothetical protein [Vibrio parahaemolyticus]
MTYQTTLNEDDIELAERTAASLRRMQIFFNENNIGPELGNELFTAFVKFTFDGNASFGHSAEDSCRIEREDPLLKQWMAEVQHIIDYIRLQNAGTISSMYAHKESDHSNNPMLKGAFLDVLLDAGTKDENPVEGTVAVLTCLCVNHINNAQHAPAGGRAFH